MEGSYFGNINLHWKFKWNSILKQIIFYKVDMYYENEGSNIFACTDIDFVSFF